MASASRSQVIRLYGEMMRESKKFSSYLYRTYALRRIRDGFKANKDLEDQKQIKQLVTSARSDLEMIKRQVIINQLYKSEPLVIEKRSG